MKTFRYVVCEGKIKSRLAAGAVVLLVGLFASAAFGDEIDDSLPPDAPVAVKASARQAIKDGLEQDNVVRLTRAMLQNRFDAQQIRHCHTLMVEAHISGMPVEPLMNKAFEGMAKGVEPSRIVGAMERVQSRNAFAYQKAAQLSGEKSRMSNLGRGLAAALAAGFAQRDAESITQMIRQRGQTMQPDKAYSLALECFYTARDVSRLGVSSRAVANMLGRALEKGFNHQQMRTMRHTFMVQAQNSQPQNLAQRYAADIQEGKGFQKGTRGDEGSRGKSIGSSGSGGSGSGGSGGSGPGGGKQ